MKHIEKITINNARRLGQNIEIGFGEGATIILAPNGTGKTTIFEAIELALTGKIKRLENFPDAIIRNGLSEMNVRLDFSRGKYCEVTYKRGGNCIRNGDFAELFDNESSSSLPYLFRLTHFLEQRCNEWFVEQDNKHAGNLLSQIPLGRDLQNIISKKISLLRASGAAETSAGEALTEAKKKLSEFEELIAKRDRLALVTLLTPLNEIVVKLLAISKLVNCEEYDNEYNVTLINVYFEKIRILHKQESERKKDLLIKLNVLRERTQLYTVNSELLSKKLTVISELSKKIAELNTAFDKTYEDLQYEKKNLFSIKEEIKKLNSQNSMFEIIEQKRINLAATKAELEQNEKKLVELNQSFEVTTENLKKIERLKDQYKFVNEEINRHKNYLTQVEQKIEFQKQWEKIMIDNEEIIEIKIPEIEKRKSEYLESKLSTDYEVAEAIKVHTMKKNALESLNEASNAIQDAVSNISKHLGIAQRNCPVCQADYEPDELAKRIENSLKTLNPLIPQAIIEEKNALEAIESAKEKQCKEIKRLHDITTELSIENDRLKKNQSIILWKFIPIFPGCRNLEEANLQLKEQIAQVTSLIIELETKRSKLEPEMTIEEITSANVKKREEERSINELKLKNENLSKVIIDEIESIKVIEEALSETEKETVNINLYEELNKEAEKMDSIQQLEAELSRIESVRKESQEIYFNENEIASKIKGSLEGICIEWNQAGLEGQPSEEKLKIRNEEISKAIFECEKTNEDLNLIEQELVNWRTAEKYNEINNEIKNEIGDFNEEAYIESLKASVEKNSNILQNIINSKSAMDSFLSNVASEYEKIHEQLNAINEPWKGLLKRIVINPIISQAPLLSNTTVRNKPIAKTSALIHQQNIDITKIASEAQLSDLQLTFMLSMANRFKWTSLKALLLDDPTQHHDLVHASSVFDVLRDYIFDFDYQVMMSTHDSIQANFFQRKLENEGIPSKVYRLIARKDGVVAERLT